MADLHALIDKLITGESLTVEEYTLLVKERTPDTAARLAAAATEKRQDIYGNTVYIRGLIEISNICKNDCHYCGIRAGNRNCDRYRLTEEDILSACAEGYELGFRTFVLQGGEDGHFTDGRLISLLTAIKAAHPDCAVTLSLGERSRESYEKLFKAGADRYLLRHETADPPHYAKLHPPELSWDNRMRCLADLKALGFQVGCGFMVGSPFQTTEALAKDLKFVETFAPDMCGIGPFIPHKDTPFANQPAGSIGMTLKLISIFRLMHPSALIPATTALASLSPDGREQGILAGANVVMPNLSPTSVREKYTLYNHKAAFGSEAAEGLKLLEEQLNQIGYTISKERGDYNYV